MQRLLTVAALLAGLAAPALAEEASTTPQPPEVQAVLAPSQQGDASATLPHSDPAAAVPMPAAVSVPLESNSAPPSKGGCNHAKSTVYLTN